MMAACNHRNIVKYIGTFSHQQDLWVNENNLLIKNTDCNGVNDWR